MVIVDTTHQSFPEISTREPTKVKINHTMIDLPIGLSLKKRHAVSRKRKAFFHYYPDPHDLAWPWNKDEYEKISKDGY